MNIKKLIDAAYPSMAKGLRNAIKKFAPGELTHIGVSHAWGSPDRLIACHFFAQSAHETAGGRYLEEIGPVSYFNRYEPRTRVGKSLGNTEKGDGYRYRGRGLIQLTGRKNYYKYGQMIKEDLLTYPERAADDAKVMLTIYSLYWELNKLTPLALRNDIVGITRKINGGTNGLASRKAWLSALQRVAEARAETDQWPLRVGSSGPEVMALQRLDKTLDVDGIFGPLTARAVIKLKERHGLEPDALISMADFEVLTGLAQET